MMKGYALREHKVTTRERRTLFPGFSEMLQNFAQEVTAVRTSQIPERFFLRRCDPLHPPSRRSFLPAVLHPAAHRPGAGNCARGAGFRLAGSGGDSPAGYPEQPVRADRKW